MRRQRQHFDLPGARVQRQDQFLLGGLAPAPGRLPGIDGEARSIKPPQNWGGGFGKRAQFTGPLISCHGFWCRTHAHRHDSVSRPPVLMVPASSGAGVPDKSGPTSDPFLLRSQILATFSCTGPGAQKEFLGEGWVPTIG